ncbi:MAG: ZIP family metal transporter [Synechococcales cyanobacterium]
MADMMTEAVWLGIVGSALASVGTGLGALPIVVIPKLTANGQGILLGLGAGVMLAATAFSLIVPGLEAAQTLWGTSLAAALAIAGGMVLGAAFLWMSHQYFPHEHFLKGREGAKLLSLKRVWLFVIAIAIHNFPEGLAVGVGFGGENIGNGLALTAGIFLQNIPEGLVVAMSLVQEGYSRREAILTSGITGFVELLGGIMGALAVTMAQPILPVGMGFAAGAMLFVISDEIIPESNRLGYEKAGTVGVLTGFMGMMILDVLLN